MLPVALSALLRPKVADRITPTAQEPQSATERECAYASQAMEDEVSKLAALVHGDGRNAALNTSAHSLGTMAGAGWIDQPVIAQALFEACRINGHFAKWGERQTRETIKSGLNAGMTKPREPLAVVPIIPISGMLASSIAAFKAKHESKSDKAPANGKRSITISSLFRIEDIRSPFDYDSKGIVFAIPGIIMMDAITVISGDSGCGKSTLITKCAEAITEGKSILGGSVCQVRDVLYLDRENSLPFIRARMNRMNIRPVSKFKYFGAHVIGEVPMPGSKEIEEWIIRTEPKPVIFVHGLIAFLEGKENSSDDIRTFFNPLRRLANLGAAVVVLHHTGKGESSESYRGSSDIKASCDVGLTLKNAGETKLTNLSLKPFKAREGTRTRLRDYAPYKTFAASLAESSVDVTPF